MTAILSGAGQYAGEYARQRLPTPRFVMLPIVLSAISEYSQPIQSDRCCA